MNIELYNKFNKYFNYFRFGNTNIFSLFYKSKNIYNNKRLLLKLDQENIVLLSKSILSIKDKLYFNDCIVGTFIIIKEEIIIMIYLKNDIEPDINIIPEILLSFCVPFRYKNYNIEELVWIE